jgi:hypothetical protein
MEDESTQNILNKVAHHTYRTSQRDASDEMFIQETLRYPDGTQDYYADIEVPRMPINSKSRTQSQGDEFLLLPRNKSSNKHQADDNKRDRSRMELCQAEKAFMLAQNEPGEEIDLDPKPVMTLKQWDEQVLSRFQAWDSSKKSKVARLRVDLIDQKERDWKYAPKINKDNRARNHTPLKDRVQAILEHHGTKMTSQRHRIEEAKIDEEMTHCTFTPRINRNQNYKSISKTPKKAEDLLKWGEQRDKKVIHRQLNDPEYQELTFKPTISSKSRTMIKSSADVDVFARLQPRPKKSVRGPDDDLDFKPKINEKSRGMAMRKAEREREENMVKNLEALSAQAAQQNSQSLQNQNSLSGVKNNQFDMEKRFQEVYEQAYSNIATQKLQVEQEETLRQYRREMDQYSDSEYTEIENDDMVTRQTSETQPPLRYESSLERRSRGSKKSRTLHAPNKSPGSESRSHRSNPRIKSQAVLKTPPKLKHVTNQMNSQKDFSKKVEKTPVSERPNMNKSKSTNNEFGRQKAKKIGPRDGIHIKYVEEDSLQYQNGSGMTSNRSISNKDYAFGKDRSNKSSNQGSARQLVDLSQEDVLGFNANDDKFKIKALPGDRDRSLTNENIPTPSSKPGHAKTKSIVKPKA